MEGVKCVSSIYRKVNNKGFGQVITESFSQNGRKRYTEIVTELDLLGNKGKRTIERNFIGIPEKVTDEVYGKVEVYVPAYPEREKGVFQITSDNVRTYFPNISFDSLCKY